MSHTIHYTHCPLCGSEEIKEALSAIDYTVSGETFQIISCKYCSVRFTQDIPDAETIGKYYKSENYISHSNTSKGLINNLYQKVRKKTLRNKKKLIQQSTGLKNGTLLDVGAGTGAFASEMKENGWEVTGLEPDAGARTIGKQLYKVDLKDITAFLDLPNESFDAITLWHVLEHVHDLQGYVIKLKSLIKEKGKLFIAVPNYTSSDASVYEKFWAAYDVPRHLYHFSPHSMQLLMEKHGLKITDYKAMWYDSFYVSMLSSKYKNGKTSLIASFWNGLLSNLKAMGNAKNCSSVIYIIEKKG